MKTLKQNMAKIKEEELISRGKNLHVKSKITGFYKNVKLYFTAIRVLWKALTTNDPKVTSELKSFQKYLNDNIDVERMLMELPDEEKKIYYAVDKNIDGSDVLKRAIFKASKIVKLEEDKRKQLKELHEKGSLIKAMMVVFDEYIDKKVDLAILIHKKQPNLSYNEKLKIKSALVESLKSEQV